MGLSFANGTIESGPSGSLQYNGFSACAGPGVALRLGHHWMGSLEGILSMGTAKWKSEPFSNSSGREFNPSFAGAVVNFSFVWGEPARGMDRRW